MPDVKGVGSFLPLQPVEAAEKVVEITPSPQWVLPSRVEPETTLRLTQKPLLETPKSYDTSNLDAAVIQSHLDQSQLHEEGAAIAIGRLQKTWENQRELTKKYSDEGNSIAEREKYLKHVRWVSWVCGALLGGGGIASIAMFALGITFQPLFILQGIAGIAKGLSDSTKAILNHQSEVEQGEMLQFSHDHDFNDQVIKEALQRMTAGHEMGLKEITNLRSLLDNQLNASLSMFK